MLINRLSLEKGKSCPADLILSELDKSICSLVVKTAPQDGHDLRRQVSNPDLVGLELVVLVFSVQYMHTMSIY